ncbi:MAG TPA: hypothetical protein VFZ53_31800 [Polyangiaceae bacterium]
MKLPRRSQAWFSILGGLVLGGALVMSACGGDDDGDDGGDSGNGGSANGGTSTAGTAGGQGLTNLRKNTAPSAK